MKQTEHTCVLFDERRGGGILSGERKRGSIHSGELRGGGVLWKATESLQPGEKTPKLMRLSRSSCLQPA